MGSIDGKARAIQSELNNILWKSIEAHPSPYVETTWFRTSTTGPFNFLTVDRPCLQSL